MDKIFIVKNRDSDTATMYVEKTLEDAHKTAQCLVDKYPTDVYLVFELIGAYQAKTTTTVLPITIRS